MKLTYIIPYVVILYMLYSVSGCIKCSENKSKESTNTVRYFNYPSSTWNNNSISHKEFRDSMSISLKNITNSTQSSTNK